MDYSDESGGSAPASPEEPLNIGMEIDVEQGSQGNDHDGDELDDLWFTRPY